MGAALSKYKDLPLVSQTQNPVVVIGIEHVHRNTQSLRIKVSGDEHVIRDSVTNGPLYKLAKRDKRLRLMDANAETLAYVASDPIATTKFAKYLILPLETGQQSVGVARNARLLQLKVSRKAGFFVTEVIDPASELVVYHVKGTNMGFHCYVFLGPTSKGRDAEGPLLARSTKESTWIKSIYGVEVAPGVDLAFVVALMAVVEKVRRKIAAADSAAAG
ncbi:hypothetical protein BC828DRAFT_396836 [Blastocladiella britannica]|nr:hypothetical protein BC828DRAFT_396836 [Blastocladiella britannica]